jgi:hypothetical protein
MPIAFCSEKNKYRDCAQHTGPLKIINTNGRGRRIMKSKTRNVSILAIIVLSLYLGLSLYRGQQEQHFQEEMHSLKKTELLHKNIDRFRACNGDTACEKLYPEAEKAIKNAEYKAEQELKQ